MSRQSVRAASAVVRHESLDPTGAMVETVFDVDVTVSDAGSEDPHAPTPPVANTSAATTARALGAERASVIGLPVCSA